MESNTNQKPQEANDEFLASLLGNSVLFKDNMKQTFALLQIDGRHKLYKINSKDFRVIITCLYFTKYEKTIPAGIRKGIIELFDSLAYSQGESMEADLRCVWDNGSILYDLHNDDQNVVCIDQSGWKIVNIQKPLFKNYPHQSPQVMPERKGSLDDFIELLNIDVNDQRLLKAYIVSSFIPWFPHPILKIEGEKGSAKSTATKLLKMLIDPSKLQTLSFPKDAREMVQQLDHHYFIGYDNLSKIPRWASDTLCRAVSGEGYSSRTLYTSDEDTIRSYIRCLSINGLDLGALQDDLLDRCLIINFNRISDDERKTEEEIWSRFNEILPGTLGAIFQIISDSMKIFSTVALKKTYRLADFMQWSCAISTAIEGECGMQNFIDDYQRMVNKQEDASIDDNVLLTALSHFFDAHEDWIGSPTQLYNILTDIVIRYKLDIRHDSWPKATNYMSKKMRSYQSLLRSNGYAIEFPQRSAEDRKIRLYAIRRPNDTEKQEVIEEQNETTPIFVK